jgi:hypothetical protein
MMRRLLMFDRVFAWLLVCMTLTVTCGVMTARASDRSWSGDISGIGPDAAVTVVLGVGSREIFTVTVRNTGTAPWGDFHFGIFDPMGGQNIANVDFLDASMGGEDPTCSQSGLTWVINDVVVGATIDLNFCSDPVMPGETAVFTVFFVNPDLVAFPGMLFYPTPVPPEGACCDVDGSCALTCEHDCPLPRTFHLEWINCVPTPCPQPPGACCDPSSGHCFFVPEIQCPVGFVWHGDWTTCDPLPYGQCPIPPPKGACCNPVTGNCTYVEQTACPTGWTWITGATCVPTNPCPLPPPVRACCDALGNCTLTTEAACHPPLMWHADWTSCVPNLCPPPVPARSTTWGKIKSTYR